LGCATQRCDVACELFARGGDQCVEYQRDQRTPSEAERDA
jgi:hypothetical protein